MTLLAIWVVALIALLPAISWARAGGGEGYSGGGGGGGGGGYGGGGGGGHGGGGGGFLIYLLIQLVFEHPLIGIPLLIFIIFLVYHGGQQGTNAYQSSVIQRGSPLIDQQQLGSAVALIRQHDPNFDQDAFCQRVTNAFLKIQQAWTAQELTAVRAFISDGVYERFSLQFAEQRDAGYRNVMDNVAVQQARVADARSLGVFDELSVRISASAADYRVRLTDGKPLAGGFHSVEQFTEIWSFLRKRGAVTDPSKSGLIEGNCPNCGAPIAMNQSANCQRCKAELRSGEYDWVLSEITQQSEWQRSASRDIPGLDALQQQDPGFDALAMEDRASVIFWRRAAADRTGKTDPLRKVASDGFCQTYADALASAGNGDRAISDCAVGSVEMLGFLAQQGDGAFERVLLEVRWSGRRSSGTVIGRTLFVLGREPGSQSDSGKSISSAHCPNCGAPEAGGTSNACEYCNTTLNDGKHGWILLELAAMASPRAQELLSQLGGAARSASATYAAQAVLGPVSDAGLVAWAVKEAVADGTVDPAERGVLETISAQRGISSERLNQMIEAALHNELDVPEPANRAEAESWLTAMANIALADGKLSNEEFALLRMLGTKFDLGEYDVKMLLKRSHSEQYANAAAALRGRSQPTRPPSNQS